MDATKAAANVRKHRVRFEIAVKVFDDPHALMDLDRFEAGEWRWRTLGLVDGVLLLLVAHTEDEDGDDEIVRIISARAANPEERRRYAVARGAGSRG